MIIDPKIEQLRCIFERTHGVYYCKVFVRELMYHDMIGMPRFVHQSNDWQGCAMFRRNRNGQWETMTGREVTPTMKRACEEGWEAWISKKIME